jgi:hypothetical protein
VAILRAEPLGWAFLGIRVLSGEEELTRLQISAFRTKGSFQLDGDAFTIEPMGFFKSDAVLKKGSSIIAKSRKGAALRRRFEISSAGHHLTLESRSWAGREYVLLLGKNEVGQVKREGFAGRKMHLEFPDDMPVFLQVFLAYIVISQARREAAAAAAGG